VLLSLQVDNLPKKLLLGVAVAYIALVVILPFLNVFLQVGWRGQQGDRGWSGGRMKCCRGEEESIAWRGWAGLGGQRGRQGVLA
jgi:hypothetical protein